MKFGTVATGLAEGGILAHSVQAGTKKLRKGLVRLCLAGEAPPPGTEILRDGKAVGTLLSAAGGQARVPFAITAFKVGEPKVQMRVRLEPDDASATALDDAMIEKRLTALQRVRHGSDVDLVQNVAREVGPEIREGR